MEECQAYQAEESEKLKSRSGGHGGIHTSGAGAAGAGEFVDDEVLGGDEEVDWFEALKAGEANE
jgi:hypothetical protein